MRSSSARIEKMERVDDRYEKMERYCWTGQRSQRAVVPIEEEEEEEEDDDDDDDEEEEDNDDEEEEDKEEEEKKKKNHQFTCT
jgi:hypothetical protein